MSPQGEEEGRAGESEYVTVIGLQEPDTGFVAFGNPKKGSVGVRDVHARFKTIGTDARLNCAGMRVSVTVIN
jgi:hypothetical protein